MKKLHAERRKMHTSQQRVNLAEIELHTSGSTLHDLSSAQIPDTSTEIGSQQCGTDDTW